MHFLSCLILASALSLAWSAIDLSSYPFKITLNTEDNGGLYELYWNFDNAAETISFAVRVQTTGWVGFGLSPNGQMPNSDVVIGWVSGGTTMFHDRFAAARAPPTVDEQQDWILEDGEEENGFTILQFRRKYVTCDDKDLPITAETARVIWSFRDTDPTSQDIPSSLIHSQKGAVSINLLGGLPNATPDPADLEYYDVTVDNITIPDQDTTYWCAAFRLPEEVRNQTRYITKFGPLVTEGNEAHVHHLLIYTCTGVTEDHVGNGGDCDGDVAQEVKECRGGVLFAAWAVGGEVFVFPNDVAFPFGGEGNPEFIVMELHYDNPLEIAGTMDSSGMRVWYSSTPREHEAGIMQIGHFVHPFHMIPPNARNFTSTAITTSECTKQFLPEDGIRVFGNLLHTHVIGHGLTVQHVRYNSDCDVYEELEPIDRNLQYDFNFQQITHLRREVIIKPGDILIVKCFYGTVGLQGVTLGGLGTRDEMCLSFLVYYPRIELPVTGSRLLDREYFEYLATLPNGEQILSGEYLDGLNAVDWNEERIDTFQTVVNNGSQQTECGGYDSTELSEVVKFPEIDCPYLAPDQCSDSPPPTCCERITGTDKPSETPTAKPSETPTAEATEGGEVLRASVVLLLVLSLLTVFMG